MRLPYRARPGLGFGLFIVVVTASSLFFGWGWQRPPLDRVWQIQLELLLGTRPVLSSGEYELLQDTLIQYPSLAENMLEDAPAGLISAHLGGMVDIDYAYVLRQTGDAPGVLTVTSPSGAPLDLVVRTATTETTGQATGDASFVLPLPATGPFPQLTEIRLITTQPAAPAAGNRKIKPMLIGLISAATGQG